VEIIKRNIGDRKEGYVFISRRKGDRLYGVNDRFDKAVRKLGLTVDGTKLRFHDLRHVFATWLHKEGVSLDTVRTLLGHRDRNTTDRYITFDPLSHSNDLKVIPRIRKQEKWQELAS